MMSNEPHYRDESLGAALRELHVPEHRPTFERELARGAHRRFRVRGFRAAVAAAVVGLALGAVLTRLGSGPALASRVQDKAASALADGRTMRGVVVSRFLRGPGEVHAGRSG
jgi:hypothetical protein